MARKLSIKNEKDAEYMFGRYQSSNESKSSIPGFELNQIIRWFDAKTGESKTGLVIDFSDDGTHMLTVPNPEFYLKWLFTDGDDRYNIICTEVSCDEATVTKPAREYISKEQFAAAHERMYATRTMGVTPENYDKYWQPGIDACYQDWDNLERPSKS